MELAFAKVEKALVLVLLALAVTPAAALPPDDAFRGTIQGFRLACERGGGVFLPAGVRRYHVALGRTARVAEIIQFTGLGCDRVARTPGCNSGGCRVVVRLSSRGRSPGPGRVLLDGPGMDPGIYEVEGAEVFAVRRHHDFCQAAGGAQCFALWNEASSRLSDTLLSREPRLSRAF